MNARTTVRLPTELLKRAKRMAAAEGRTLTSLIEDGLRLMISEERQKAKKPRGPVPVSKATGGLMPGVDISDSAALQEMEDLEYIERLKSGFK